MTLPVLFTYISFGLWAFGTIAIVIIAFCFPELVRKSQHSNKLSVYDTFHIILISTILAWIAMWCFRSMY
jgi:hypothetical protein